MESFMLILTPVLQLAAMILTGYFCEKLHYVENLSKRVGDIILKVTLPCLLLASMTGKEIDSRRLKGIGLTVLLALVSVLLLVGIGFFTGKLFRIKKETLVTHTLAAAFGNVVFIGYPIIRAFLGEGDSFLYAVFYGVTNDALLYTFGIFLLSGKSNLKKLLNPNTVCITIGMILMLLGFHFPTPVWETLQSIGSITTPLSMFFIGSVLSGVPLRDFFKSKTIFVNVLIKMLIFPIVVCLLFKGHLPYAVLAAVVLQAAMPCQTTLTIVADGSGGDRDYAARSVAITTALCVLTMPFIYYMLQKLAG